MARLKKPWKKQFQIKANPEWLNVLQGKHNGLATTHTKPAPKSSGKVRVYTVLPKPEFDEMKVPIARFAKGENIKPKFETFVSDK